MKSSWWYFSGLLIFIALVLVMAWVSLPPRNFPVGQIVEIESGAGLNLVASTLKSRHIITSRLFFITLMRLEGKQTSIKAGLYEFERPLSAPVVATRLATGNFAAFPAKFVVPEGLRASELAKIIVAAFPHLDPAEVGPLVESNQGYLFPATYELPPHATAEQVVRAMRQNFDRAMQPLQPAFAASPHSLAEIITMASLVEEEAASSTDRSLIAGILWKRLAAGQKLEVDVATSTYATTGLPAAPIANPGLDSIKAALAPRSSDYWFYLSDKHGIIHYAKDYEEHKRNIARFY